MFSINHNKTPNPHLNNVTDSDLDITKKIVNFLLKKHKTKIDVLNIGGGYKKQVELWFENNENINYHCLDIQNKENNKNVIIGDITDKNLNIGKEFDFIYTSNTLEHILNPWDATENIIKLLKENSIFICIVPFSWRYHACCYDSFRYSHTGLRYLFERYGKIEHVFSGYKKHGSTNGWYKGGCDKTLDGNPFTESIMTIYVAKKNSSHVFDINDIDKSNLR